jgi:protein SCO1/2
MDILVRTVPTTPTSLSAPRSAVPLRWLFWGVLLMVGVAAGIGVRLVGTSTRAVAPIVPLSEAPAGTWAAGKLRAPDFSLADQNGASVSLAGFRGRPVILTFIDPLCRDYCPLEAKRLNTIVRSLPAGTRPTIVAVSVNVYGNARGNLVQDAQKWSLVPEWRWGIGSGTELAAVWKSYHVGVLVSTKKIAGVAVHYVAHTEAAYVIDAKGYQRAVFLWPYSADAVTRTLRSLTSSS